MNIDRVQGLIDIGRIKSRDAALVMAEYLVLQGLITQDDYEAVEIGIELPEPINLKELLEERDGLLMEIEASKTVLPNE